MVSSKSENLTTRDITQKPNSLRHTNLLNIKDLLESITENIHDYPESSTDWIHFLGDME